MLCADQISLSTRGKGEDSKGQKGERSEGKEKRREGRRGRHPQEEVWEGKKERKGGSHHTVAVPLRTVQSTSKPQHLNRTRCPTCEMRCLVACRIISKRLHHEPEPSAPIAAASTLPHTTNSSVRRSSPRQRRTHRRRVSTNPCARQDFLTQSHLFIQLHSLHKGLPRCVPQRKQGNGTCIAHIVAHFGCQKRVNLCASSSPLFSGVSLLQRRIPSQSGRSCLQTKVLHQFSLRPLFIIPLLLHHRSSSEVSNFHHKGIGPTLICHSTHGERQRYR